MSKDDTITEDLIRALVEAFYARVRVDDQLGPIFAGAIDVFLRGLGTGR